MEKTIKIYWVLSLLFLCACGDAGGARRRGWEVSEIASTCEKIVDGTVADEPRSTVWLPGCTGVYVADGVVLTAAHCGNLAYVEADGVIRSNLLYVPHPDYSGGADNDLALMFLDGPLPLDIAVLGSPRAGEALTQGYGQTETGEPSEDLLERTVEIVGERKGRIIGTEATCFGDSGGPLYQDGKLVGVTRGGERGDCRGLGDFTRVDAFTGWLQSEAAINFAGGC